MLNSAIKYTVHVEESEDFAVFVPGCHSQRDTEAEALENIADTIREYLEVARNNGFMADVRRGSHDARDFGPAVAGSYGRVAVAVIGR